MAASSRVRLRAVQAEKARATRRRVVAAAGALFVRDGYLQTTMAAVAAEAGVSVRTVYQGFGGKAELLSEALDVAIVGDDEPVPVMDRQWFRRMLAEPRADAALEMFVQGSAAVIGRIYPLYAVTRDGSADPELAEVLARNKDGRRVVHGRAVQAVLGKAGAASGVDPRWAADVVYTLLSQETYGLMVVERGLPEREWARWVGGLLAAQLLGGSRLD